MSEFDGQVNCSPLVLIYRCGAGGPLRSSCWLFHAQYLASLRLSQEIRWSTDLL